MGAKRTHDGTAKAEKMNKPLKVAATKIETDEALKKHVRDQSALEVMAKAQQLMVAPEATMELRKNLTKEEVAAIREWMETESERNGPAFYSKLIQFFVPGYAEFRTKYDQWTTAKVALEKAFAYRMHVLFMTPEGSLTREGIKDALDQRDQVLKAVEKQIAEQRLRQNDVAQALQSQEAVAAMLQNPQTYAMIAQMMNQPAPPPGTGAGAGLNAMDT